jgi:ABC-type dipeptide/oligopeptide/nickel transport system permease subunit
MPEDRHLSPCFAQCYAPTITVLAQDFGFLIGGIVAVETIFAYPGVGRLLVYSPSRHDLPLMQAAVLVVPRSIALPILLPICSTGLQPENLIWPRRRLKVPPRPVARRRRLPRAVIFGGTILIVMILAAVMANWLAPYPFDQFAVRDRLTGPVWPTGRAPTNMVAMCSAVPCSARGFLVSWVCRNLDRSSPRRPDRVGGRILSRACRRVADARTGCGDVVSVAAVRDVDPGDHAARLDQDRSCHWNPVCPPVARVTRSVTLDLMTGEFIVAARARGERAPYILLREILPNVWPAIVVEGSLRVAFAILLGAVLSFLGFGVQPPAADWGLMISTSRDFVDVAPWMAITPGLAMSLTVIAVSLLGDGLREHLDPKFHSTR